MSYKKDRWIKIENDLRKLLAEISKAKEKKPVRPCPASSGE